MTLKRRYTVFVEILLFWSNLSVKWVEALNSQGELFQISHLFLCVLQYFVCVLYFSYIATLSARNSLVCLVECFFICLVSCIFFEKIKLLIDWLIAFIVQTHFVCFSYACSVFTFTFLCIDSKCHIPFHHFHFSHFIINRSFTFSYKLKTHLLYQSFPS